MNLLIYCSFENNFKTRNECYCCGRCMAEMKFKIKNNIKSEVI